MTFPAQLISYFSKPQFQVSYNRSNVSSGTTDFVVPDGVFSLSAVVIAGGGGGAGGGTLNGGASKGGGGGGLTWGVFSVQPGDILTANIGAGGDGGTNNNNGLNGENSSLVLKSRNGTPIGETILLSTGGQGGTKANSFGSGGLGGIAAQDPFFPVNFQMYYRGGGSGGEGGPASSANNIGPGGGGAGGYDGNGGNGGGLDGGTTVNPTAAIPNSGGGGGGGYATGALGYGGGGVGAFGFDGTTAGIAGVNNAAGGGGGSSFNDPGSPINAEFIGSASTDQSFLSYSDVNLNGVPSVIGGGDFLLLLSATDTTSGPNQIPVPNASNFPPVGFTTIVVSTDSEYLVSSSSTTNFQTVPYYQGDGGAPDTPTRDLNFTTSYAYVPPGGLTSGTLTGLETNCIHNLIVLRYIPDPADFAWANTSGDPALNPGSGGADSQMPDPPSISGIPPGAVRIISGFLANNILNPGDDVSGFNSNFLTSAGGGKGGVPGQGIGVAGQYTVSAGGSFGSPPLPIVSTNLGIGATVNPDKFLTGTAAHARAYTIELTRTNSLNPITLVGTASTSDSEFLPAITNRADVLSTPSNTQGQDLIILVAALDNPGGNNDPTTAPQYGVAGENFTRFTDNGANVTAIEGSDYGGGGTNNRFDGRSQDERGGGGLRFYVGWYRVPQTLGTPVGSQAIDLNFPVAGGGAGNPNQTPNAVMISVFRNATIPVDLNYAIWDNRTVNPLTPGGTINAGANDIGYGAPDPGPIGITSANSAVISFALVDNTTISNVVSIEPPAGYIGLDERSYGVPDDGVIVMSAYKAGVTSSVEDPGNFIGNGGNIWAAQHLVIGGPGGQTTGTNLSPGTWGGGGAGANRGSSNNGMPGAPGAVRIIWGNGRSYPFIISGTGNVPETNKIAWT